MPESLSHLTNPATLTPRVCFVNRRAPAGSEVGGIPIYRTPRNKLLAAHADDGSGGSPGGGWLFVLELDGIQPPLAHGLFVGGKRQAVQDCSDELACSQSYSLFPELQPLA